MLSYNPYYALESGQDLGVQQMMYDVDGTKKQDVLYVLKKARNYMEKIVPWKFNEGMRSVCKNTHEMCALWAVWGECENTKDCKLLWILFLGEKFGLMGLMFLFLQSCA